MYTNTMRMMRMKNKSSFTLVELLIVIGILAILSAAVVIIIQPQERLREARDSQRIQELSSLERTIQLLESQVLNLSLGNAQTVYVSVPDSSSSCANLGLPSLPAGYSYACSSTANYRKTNGTGWIPVNFQSSSIGTLATLPIDPINTTSTGLYYTYIPGGSFELNGIMESAKKRADTSLHKKNLPGVIAKGNDLALNPLYNTQGLVGYWTFDEGSGTTANDSSGNNNTGTLTNGPTWQSGTSCKVGGCLSFDGSNDNVVITNQAYINDLGKVDVSYSISFWVNSASSGTSISEKWIGIPYPWAIRYNTSNINFAVYN